jgi:hypothetical protein
MQTKVEKVELEYIPRSFYEEPKVRLMIFRERGGAILDITHSAIAEVCQPASEGRADMLSAFRESVPLLLQTLNKTIAATPPGGVVIVTPKMLRGKKLSAA